MTLQYSDLKACVYFFFVVSIDSVINLATLEVHCGINEVIFSQVQQLNKK